MNELFGLRANEIELIKTILARDPAVQEAIIFGSRAKGNHKPGSDVDIALKGDELTLNNISLLSDILNEETLMPYNFDLIDYYKIRNQELKDHIDRIGIRIFP